MGRLMVLAISLFAFVLISNLVNSQGIGANVETGKDIDANLIHDLTKAIDSKVETANTIRNLDKFVIDEAIIRNFLANLTRELTKEERHYLIQELQRTVQAKSRVARQATSPEAKITKITYNLGKRVAGDRIIASNSVVQQWTTPQNVSQTLTYPRIGVGSVITYVEVIVEQVKHSKQTHFLSIKFK